MFPSLIDGEDEREALLLAGVGSCLMEASVGIHQLGATDCLL